MNFAAIFRTILGAGLVATAAVPIATAIADDDLPYMARITIERSDDEPLGDSVRGVLYVSNPASAAANFRGVNGVDVSAHDENTVSIIFSDKPTFAEQPGDQYGRSSFVIDFDEAAVAALTEELRSAHSDTPTPDEIAAFVYAHISEKSYSRAFDFASRVAANGEGNCTEHAVLLAAIARANGYFARVAMGTLIIDTDNEPLAFGHAWTEIYIDSGWQIKDATLPEGSNKTSKFRYLPISLIRDEGPGYNFSMADMLQTMPIKIAGIENTE